MKMIVGLGNPGQEYGRTRHSVGFYMADRLAEQYDAPWARKARLRGSIALSPDHDLVIFKPETYMNASGEAVRAAADFYKVAAADILVIHDDADMEFGKLRAVTDGSDGGHKGVQSLHEHGLESVWRLKVGVSNDERQPGQAIDFVLRDFSAGEWGYLPQLAEAVMRLCRDFLAGGLERHSRKSSHK